MVKIPDEGFVGTVKRTWLERDQRRVGRVYKIEQLEEVEHIHYLCTTLHQSGVPVQILITEPVFSGDRFMVYYSYSYDSPEDFSDGWYSPDITSKRLKSAAMVFANFQKVALEVKGPEKPLDYPYCNTIKWIYDEDPISKLVGSWKSSLQDLGIDRFGQIVLDLIENSLPGIQDLVEGLCHGDFHSGNTIILGDEIQQIVDFGFWINHPLIFDLAISIEMWARNWDSETFELDKRRFCEFVDEYEKRGGPIKLTRANMYMLPLSRLWIETYGARRYSDPKKSDWIGKYLNNALLRVNWYMDNMESYI